MLPGLASARWGHQHVVDNSHVFIGETRDTADMGMMSTFLGEKMVPSKRRARLFRTWGAGIGMLPVGGQAIWGNQSWAPDDTDEMHDKNLTFG